MQYYRQLFEDLFLKGMLTSIAVAQQMLTKAGIFIKGNVFENGLSLCLQRAFGTEQIFGKSATDGITEVETVDDIPIGPYIASVASDRVVLGSVYRVIHDDHMASMSGVLPNGTDGTFRYSPANTYSDSTVGIPVPSRLYSNGTKSETQPLKGLRVTVKDIIDLKGVKTSQGNRAWFKLYDAKNASSPAMQKLIDLGATIIGKTKTAQFANADRVTADWVDYQYVINFMQFDRRD